MSETQVHEVTESKVDPLEAMSHFSCPTCNEDGSPEDRSLCGVLLFGTEEVPFGTDPHPCPMCLTYTRCPACGVPFRWPS